MLLPVAMRWRETQLLNYWDAMIVNDYAGAHAHTDANTRGNATNIHNKTSE